MRQSAVAGLGTGWKVTVTAHADALPGPMLGRRKPPSRWCPKSSERRPSAPPHVYARTAMTGALVLTLVLAAQVAAVFVGQRRVRADSRFPRMWGLDKRCGTDHAHEPIAVNDR